MLTHPLTSLDGLGEALEGDARKCLARTLRAPSPKDVCTDAVVTHLKRLGIPLSDDGLLGYTQAVALSVGALQRSLAMSRTGEVDVATWNALLLPAEVYKRRTVAAAPTVKAWDTTAKETRVKDEQAAAAKQAEGLAIAQAMAVQSGLVPQQPVDDGPDWQTWAMIGGGAVAGLALLYVVLKK